MEENLYHLKEIEDTSATASTGNDTDDLPIRRRAFIWFAVPRVGVEPGNETECGNSADDFPDFFTLAQMKAGAIVVPIVVCIYGFCLIAIVCDNYFIPCVEKICEELNLSEVRNLSGRTFFFIQFDDKTEILQSKLSGDSKRYFILKDRYYIVISH